LRPNAWAEPLRKALHAQLDAYAQDHFADGAVVVVPLSLGIGRRRAAQPAQKKQKEKEKEALVVVVETTEESGETADEQKETQEEQTDAAEEMCEAEAKEDTPAAAAAAAAEPQASEEEEEEESQDDVDVDSETQGATRFVIHVVGNKYSLSNFWCVSVVCPSPSSSPPFILPPSRLLISLRMCGAHCQGGTLARHVHV
jgi:hypothetical protein